MKDENIKQLIYDIQREKDSQKQVELVKTFETTSKTQILSKYSKIVPTNPVAQINESSVSVTGLAGHKFAVGTKIKFPTFEMLQQDGWIDDGEYIVHPIYKTVFLSYLQIAEFEDTEVTIAYQNNPGEYSIEEEGLYDDWPFDLMNFQTFLNRHGLEIASPDKLEFDDQSLQEQVFHILHYLESEPNQMIIPDGRVRLLKETLGDYKPYNEVCYLPLIKNLTSVVPIQDQVVKERRNFVTGCRKQIQKQKVVFANL